MFDSAGIHPVVISTIFALNAEVSNAPLPGAGRLLGGERPATGPVGGPAQPPNDPDDREEILCW